MNWENDMFLEKREIIKQVRSLLFYHQQLGLDIYPKADELQEFLGIQPQYEKVKGTYREDNNYEIIPPKSELSNNIVLELPQRTIDEIAEEIRVCSSCNLCKERILPVPGRGGPNARLLVVGDWLTTPSSEDSNSSSVFGHEEDMMLSRMLKAIHLPDEAAFVTNVIKCGIKTNVQPKKENVESCVSYLYRQMAATTPEIICTMGTIATRALLQSPKPLSQLRGKFHEYKQGEQSIALMPTYHPSFLLKNPEMKMATWNDLQMIEKKLKS